MMDPATRAEMQRMMQEELGRLTLIGDKEISAHGRWPNFTLGFHPPRQMQQPFGGSGGDQPAPRLSFQAITRKISGTWKWGLWPGVLFDTDDNNNTELSITGLLAADLSSGFLTIPTYPAQIGLEIAVSWSATTPTVTSTSVITGTIGSSTLDERIEYVTDGATPPTYSQTYARCVLATAIDDGTGKPFLSYSVGDLQLYFTNRVGYLSGGGTPQAVPCVCPFRV